ncbi:hypothetical protein JCM21714_2806 [Gracilibacillus boraciitolerans JCM 21714]|uniref:Uncharacterized protein n=1 Tax=Gracilibacillus boraciitolerans JCM 21714 TaxID=1298598 RepID=W4VLJ8_9BACI|nr:hypothetical protein [Gracilibacillus boraciitolerans]GAE93703.1 hypothetical protein JCM21714_2806 [Gracilibacillus boraciitolerans JCM 21714]
MKPSNLYPHTFTFQDETFHLSQKPFVKRFIEINIQKISWWNKEIREGGIADG